MLLNSPVDLERFAEEFERRVEAVYRDPALVELKHKAHPWVTGHLGDPFSPVWFVAENPSLTQANKVLDAEPCEELQWSISKGDHLFREALHRARFKDGKPCEPGGWKCYITDVIKSASVVKEFSAIGGEARWRLACAWSPVFEWELAYCRPEIIVFVGARALQYTKRLIRWDWIPDPVRDWDARLVSVPHYVYVTARPDNRRKLGANAQVRRDEFISQFAEIGAARDALPVFLAVADGQRLYLGTYREVHEAFAMLDSIFTLGSGMGRFSYFVRAFLLRRNGPLDPETAKRVGLEAAELLRVEDEDLGPALDVVQRVAGLAGSLVTRRTARRQSSRPTTR